MMSLTMMGLTPGLLVRALSLFNFMNPLVLLETPLVVLTILLVVSWHGVWCFFNRNRVNW